MSSNVNSATLTDPDIFTKHKIFHIRQILNVFHSIFAF